MSAFEAIRKKFPHNWWIFRFYLISCLLISFILSLFDWHPDWNIWKLDIARNIVLSCSVGGLAVLIGNLYSFKAISNNWLRYFLSFILWIVGGWLGTILGWVLNDWWFGFNITHPLLFFSYTSAIILIIFIIIKGYDILRTEIRRMAIKLSEKEIAEQKLIQLKTKAELEAIRSKVNPHFFFNTLNSIASLIPTNPLKAEKLIERFSALFRYPFTLGDDDMVPLNKEIGFIQDYLEIEKTRLGNRLDFDINMDKSLSEFLIPAMLLQPLVENSLIHGIAPSSKGGKISVNCQLKGAFCQIEIVDNGQGFDEEKSNSGFGLSGARNRLELHYGLSHQFTLQQNDGVRIKILLPLKQEVNE